MAMSDQKPNHIVEVQQYHRMEDKVIAHTMRSKNIREEFFTDHERKMQV